MVVNIRSFRLVVIFSEIVPNEDLFTHSTL